MAKMTRACLRLSVISLFAIAVLGCSHSDSSEQADEAASESSSTPAVADSQPNAADAYARVWAKMGDHFIDPLADVHWDVPPTGAAAQFLASHQDVIADIIAATKIEHCDSHVDLARGFDVLVPHLGHMRAMARMLQNDANRIMSSPDGPHAAAERLAALIRLGRHSGRDPMLIDKLVCMSILGLASESIAAWKNKIPIEDRRAILTELEAVKTARLFDMKPVLQQELTVTVAAVRQETEFKVPDRDGITIAPAERPGVIDALEHAYHSVEALWDKPDAEHKIAVTLAALQNPKASVLIPNWDTIRKDCSSIDGKLNRAIAAMK